MATCTKPACGSAAAWRGRDGREYCGSHVLDVTPAERLPVVAEEALHDQPQPPINAAMARGAFPPRPADPPPVDEGILAAICPPGWWRSPLDGRPVMPLVGRLLFPGDADGLPTLGDMQRQMGQLYDYLHERRLRDDDFIEFMRPCWVSLIQAVIGDAMVNRRNGRDGLSQATEHALSECIDEVLRFRGEVRIRKTKFGEWEEVTNG